MSDATQKAEGPQGFDPHNPLDRWLAMQEVTKVIEGLRLALDALAFYAGPNPRREEDGGDRAREAIKQIEGLVSGEPDQK